MVKRLRESDDEQTAPTSLFETSPGYVLGENGPSKRIKARYQRSKIGHLEYQPGFDSDEMMDNLSDDEDPGDWSDVMGEDTEDPEKAADEALDAMDDGALLQDVVDEEEMDEGAEETEENVEEETEEGDGQEAEVIEGEPPELGDEEFEQADGSMAIRKGTGIRSERQIQDALRLDPRFEQNLIKSKIGFMEIIRRTNADSAGRRSNIHDFADAGNKKLPKLQDTGDAWVECLLGTADSRGKSYTGDQRLDPEYLKLGFHPDCTCPICQSRLNRSDLAKARQAEKEREIREKELRQRDKADKIEKREMRKSAKETRSGRKMDEGCKLNEEWLD
ncbi:hypothetical protein HBI24_049320 [Parastagonospora nodorum]|nr:hypothetical protein HBH53_090860 [Parastagonospora nodorum]KAH3958813.1 hypothetical protein HBH51_205970 [Parastagonospora nodorum]KAH3974643.1 hypothetical protein HBH52_130900 [Parastagonospora nodorum]KAH4048539.1 hypothetical protein HBH49_159950 [Parastagonospora nodorum]KAH4119943.1 hypothetical protein HBH47_119870 [Parastagonospora nodorum]